MLRFPSQRPALVSIHDVAPETLATVLQIVDHLRSLGIQTVTLLVIPGRDWDAHGLETLRSMQQQGCQLAGHGWVHRCGPKRTWYHRLHGWCLSRNVAEHLSLDREGIEKLIRDCHAWFGESELGEPQLYVPPAWAMGSIPFGELRDLPFRYYEVVSGVYDAQRNVFRRLPLLGYEADTAFRSVALRCLNTLNVLLSARLDRPFRVAIHPFDLQLRLSESLKKGLGQIRHAVGYEQVSAAVADRQSPVAAT